jgi:hypothetical protein
MKAGGSRVRRYVVALVALAALAVAAPAAEAQGPPTLSGENFQAFLNFFGGDESPTGNLDVTGQCDPNGPSTFQFTAEGPATGPYPGTFQESGTFTLTAPLSGPVRNIASFEATFTIDSPLGEVTGRKFQTAEPAVPASSCTDNGDFTIVNTQAEVASYEATLPAATGTVRERGTTAPVVHKQHHITTGSPDTFLFSESFAGGSPIPPGPTTVTVTPPAATNEIGDQHCVTATVRDENAMPLAGVSVVFEVSGANPQPAQTKVTDANGEAQFCYTGFTPGEDVIKAFADTNGNGSQDAGEPSGVASKTYVIPPSTEGCGTSVTAGWFVADNGDRATFGGNAKALLPALTQGEQEYQDHGPATELTFHSLQTLSVVCAQNRARIFGIGRVDQTQPVHYRIDIADNGEPSDADTYRIRLSNGYDSGEHTLLGGNIQVQRH